MSSAARAASPAQEVPHLDLDLLTVRQAPQLGDSRRAPYSFTASLMLSHGSVFGLDALRDANISPSGPADDSKARLLLTDPAGKPLIGGSPTLGPRFRLESKGQRFEVRPRRHSIWLQYTREFN